MATAQRRQALPPPGAVDWLLVSALVVVAPLVQEMPTWVTGAYVTAVVWRYAHGRWQWPQPWRVLRWGLALAGGVLVFRYYGTLLGRDAGVALLVWLTGLKLLELGSLRDAMLAAFLLLLILLGSFLYANSLLLGLYVLAAVTAVTAVLVRLQHPPLPLLPTWRLVAGIVAQALPLMLVAYLLFPRLPGALWGLEAGTSQSVTGIPAEMTPGDISSLNASYDIAFRAHFDSATPANRELYWRVRVFWDTDGRKWQVGPALLPNDVLRALGNPVSYRLSLEPSEALWLPVLDLPATAPPRAQARAGFVYEERAPRRERQTYELASYTRYQTGSLTPIEQQRALTLPPRLSERVRALASSWRTTARRDMDVAQAALDHFRNEEFFYTLTPPPLGSDPVDEFLFGTRRGFCEHYASAFVTLMRAAGVPSRVVVGYQGGVYNPTGNYVIVRQADAHAWAEIWLPEAGWTRVDPTAAISPARVEFGIEGLRRLNQQGMPLSGIGAEAVRLALQLPWLDRAWLRTRLSWDYLNMAWYFWVPGYGLERQLQFLDRLGLTDWSVFAMIGALGLLVAFYAAVHSRQRRKRDLAQRLYEVYCRKLARAGIVRAASEGPIALAERARGLRPDLASAVDAVTQLYVSIRYGRASTVDAQRAFASAVRAFRVR